MAVKGILSTATFKPFSYEEMLAPVLMATQEHQKLEESYSELEQKANIWEKLANEQNDEYAYNMYKKYSDDLRSYAEDLATRGLNAGSRKDLLKMKGRYSSEIIPIENAYNRRQQLVDEQRKAMLEDDSLLFDTNASTLSLEDLIKNPSMSYSAVSGQKIAANVESAAKELSKLVREDPIKGRHILGDMYYEAIIKKGYSPEEVLLAAYNDPTAPKELRRIVEDVIDSTGIKKWSNNENALREAYSWANRGLWKAVGEDKAQILENWKAKMRESARLEGLKEEQTRLNSLAINPLNIYNSRELSEEEKKYKNAIKEYSNYFITDAKGNVRITEEGMKEYRRDAGETAREGLKAQEFYGVPSSVSNYSDTEFKKFMDSIGMNPILGTVDNWNAYAIGDLWKNYLNNNLSAKAYKYDATKATEYDYTISSDQQDDMKDAILTAVRGTTLKEVDYNGKNKRFEETGEELTTEDLKNSKYKVTATRFSPYGNTVMIQDDKGAVKRFRLPVGINPYNEEFRDIRMADALAYQERLNDPNLSEGARLKYENAYKTALQQAYLYHSQLGVQNKTKKQEYNPYGY